MGANCVVKWTLNATARYPSPLHQLVHHTQAVQYGRSVSVTTHGLICVTMRVTKSLISLVGAGRFELPTPSPPDWCANQAALRSVPLISSS